MDSIPIEVADHRVIWAEGARSETYIEGGDRFIVHVASEFELEAIRMRPGLLAA